MGCQGICQFLFPPMEGEPVSIVEQLFLDIPIDHILNLHPSLENAQLDEPWADEYVNAIFENRLGDAIWGRYQMFGDLKDGLIDGGLTRIESITEDAVGYKHAAPDDYAAVISLYEQSSSTDGHAEVIEIILRIGRKDVSGLVLPDPSSEPRLGFLLDLWRRAGFYWPDRYNWFIR